VSRPQTQWTVTNKFINQTSIRLVIASKASSFSSTRCSLQLPCLGRAHIVLMEFFKTYTRGLKLGEWLVQSVKRQLTIDVERSTTKCLGVHATELTAVRNIRSWNDYNDNKIQSKIPKESSDSVRSHPRITTGRYQGYFVLQVRSTVQGSTHTCLGGRPWHRWFSTS
jgi:hypothetical protein